jgi:hypothetical protein
MTPCGKVGAEPTTTAVRRVIRFLFGAAVGEEQEGRVRPGAGDNVSRDRNDRDFWSRGAQVDG